MVSYPLRKFLEILKGKKDDEFLERGTSSYLIIWFTLFDLRTYLPIQSVAFELFWRLWGLCYLVIF